MERLCDYDFSKTKVDYCFINEPTKNSDVTLEEIIDETSSSILIYDTEEFVLFSFLKKAEKILNDGTKIVIGLISDKELLNLKQNGVKGGFFRSTNIKSNVAIIIVDKKKYYVAFDENCIYKVKEGKSLNEIFEYINHIIWTRTLSEVCQGQMTKVNDSRLSVVKPILKNTFVPSNYEYGTKEIQANALLLAKEENANKDAIVLKSITKRAYCDETNLYINLFEDCFYPIEKWKTLIKSKSFENKTYDELVGKQIWYNGKTITIKKEDSITKTIEKPLDEYKNFIPDFESIAREYKGECRTLHIHANIEPMKINNDYKLSDSYSKIANITKEINTTLDRIQKLVDDKSYKKKIDLIRNEVSISSKVDLYNNFISKLDFGVDALRKSKNFFNTISFERSLVVPSEILGKLYCKDKQSYLALTSEDKIDDAKKWLKDNKIEAVLILG